MPSGDSSAGGGAIWLRIQDLSDNEGGASPGADIYAIGLRKSGETTTRWADEVVSAGPGTARPQECLGEPAEPIDCASGLWTSIGGEDAYFFVSFGDEAIESGDTIIIQEISSADCPDSGGEATSYEVAAVVPFEQFDPDRSIGTFTGSAEIPVP